MARSENKLSPPIIVALLVLGTMVLVYSWVPPLPPQEEGQSAPVYKTVTVDADGSVNKQGPVLSKEFLGQLPNGFLRYFIFGIDPELVSAGRGPEPPFDSADMITAVFSVKNSVGGILLEYREYFQATDAPQAEQRSDHEIFVLNGSFYAYVSATPHARGSEVRVSLIPTSQYTVATP